MTKLKTKKRNRKPAKNIVIPPPYKSFPENYCGECHKKLTVIPWNTRGDIKLCDNTSCSRYLQPQGWISHGRLSLSEVFH
jgi:hypothetical protein